MTNFMNEIIHFCLHNYVLYLDTIESLLIKRRHKIDFSHNTYILYNEYQKILPTYIKAFRNNLNKNPVWDDVLSGDAEKLQSCNICIFTKKMGKFYEMYGILLLPLKENKNAKIKRHVTGSVMCWK